MATLPTAIAADVPLPQRLARARALSDDLFRIVHPAAIYDRPIPERHRIVFYLGHLEAFDWNLLSGRLFDLSPFEPAFDQLFAFGIDPVDGGLPSDQPHEWPRRDQIEGYNRRVRDTLDRRLAALFEDHKSHPREAAQLLHVAIEHRLMHVETLAYMLHRLPADRKIARPSPPEPPVPPATPRMVEIPPGKATLGLRRSDDGPFGWDNEFDEHGVEVDAFAVDAYPVTNGEFLKFVDSGGYTDRSLWTEPDWAWIQSSGTTHPAFWIRRGDKWLLCSMFGEILLPANWPVYVSHAEAAAYARWRGKELPSEAEWHRAAYGAPDGSERPYPWGSQPPEASRGNLDCRRWDPAPVNAFPAGKSAFGVSDLIGNGWEWTRTIFGPFPGFEPFPFYPGYSANFFDGQHYVMKGGSSRTDACMARRSFRNWFQPRYPYVYATFRCVER